MPVITRSGPTRKMTGVKRKFVEIDSDDETETVCSTSDSEYYPDQFDELKDNVDDLKEEMRVIEQENDTLIDILVNERETSNILRDEISNLKNELDEVRQQRDALITELKKIENSSLIELLVFATILSVVAGSLLSCSYGLI